ncbi:hypothetical protein M514_01105, partial [Trichuris suis]
MNDGTAGENDDGFDCSPCCANERFRRIVKTVLLGQLLSLCQCAAAITTQYLDNRYNFQAPTAQSFTAYFFLMLVYGSTLAFRSSEPNLVQIFRLRGWKYFVLALIDVEATFLMVKAYHYTGLASVQLLDCFTIPVVLVLSFFFLKIRYLPTHIIGVCLCLVGVGCVVWGDIELGHQLSDGSNRVAGDLMCLSGAALYGVSNVIQEWLLRLHERTEYLGMIGIFGSFISGIQLYIALARVELIAPFVILQGNCRKWANRCSPLDPISNTLMKSLFYVDNIAGLTADAEIRKHPQEMMLGLLRPTRALTLSSLLVLFDGHRILSIGSQEGQIGMVRIERREASSG